MSDGSGIGGGMNDSETGEGAAAGGSAKIVRMVNQIAGFFSAYPEAQAIASTADHLRKFWDPGMRRSIIDHLAAGGEGLSPIARRAVAALEAPRAG